MKKFLIIILIIFSILPSSIAFAAKVGYTNKSCYIYAKPSTSSARRKVAQNTKLYYVGSYKKFYIVKISGHSRKVCILKKNVSKYKIKAKVKTTPTPIPSPTITPIVISEPTGWAKTEKLTWAKSKNILKVGKKAKLYDIKNGYELEIKRVGGLNHMDVEPCSKYDTEQLWHIAQGYFSWKCHPMILIVGDRYIACSINTMPHGRQTIKKNDFEGHFCIHLVNSKTHGTKKVNKEHQKCIDKAYKWSQSI